MHERGFGSLVAVWLGVGFGINYKVQKNCFILWL